MTIAKFFKEIGWVDERGSGVRHIYKYNRIYLGGIPELIEGNIFKIMISLTSQDDERILMILDFCTKPRIRQEIQDEIGMKNREYFRKTLLNPLVKVVY